MCVCVWGGGPLLVGCFLLFYKSSTFCKTGKLLNKNLPDERKTMAQDSHQKQFTPLYI